MVEPIAIVGIGCRFPGNVNNPNDFWKLLSEGGDAITDIPEDRWSKRLFYHPDKARLGKIYAPKGGFVQDIDKFDPEFFGISPREAAFIDPQQRMLLETTWEALEDAGIDPHSLAGSNTGVFVGLFMHDYENIHLRVSERNLKGAHSATGTSITLAANRISYIYDFKGPSIVVDTACSSSLISIHLACQSIMNNESEVVIAGGVNTLMNPEITISLCKASMLSPDGYSRAFDSRANGYVRAEGAGMLVLKRLSQAIKDDNQIYAVIRSSTMNQDGRGEGQTVPNKEAQEAAIKKALEIAHVKPADIQYMEAHGTGTSVGDPIEANAIGTVLSQGRNKNNPCIIGSLKTNIGHTESAAGVAGVIKLALMLQYKKIPKNLHFKKPNPGIDFEQLKLRVPVSLEEWKTKKDTARIAGINSFGFGGSNAHAIIEEYVDENKKTKKNIEPKKDKRIVVSLSGHTEQALLDVAKSHLAFFELEENKNVKLEDYGYTNALCKGQHDYRLTLAVKNKPELKEYLSAYINQERRLGMSFGRVDQSYSNKLCFVFSGMGQQWWAMGRELLKEEPEYRRMVERCDGLFKKHTKKWSLLKELTKNEADSLINKTSIAQPAIFALQVALFELWRSRKIIPDIIVGHSVGEVAAVYAAGILSLEDAIKVCYNRSRLQETTAGKGTMLAVGLPVSKSTEIINFYNDVSIAAINSPNSVTIAGNTKSLKEIEKILKAEDVFVRFLKVEVPYHSVVMEEILPELTKSLADIKPKKGNIPLISTVTGKVIDGTKIDAKYWCKNVREPVQFNQSIDAIVKQECRIFIEIGAHPVLATSINECLANVNVKATVLPSLKRKESDTLILTDSIGKLYCVGYPIDWKVFYSGQEKFIKLPSYSWQKESYWVESDISKQSRIGIATDAMNAHPLIGEQTVGTVVPTWRNEIDLYWLPYLKDHMVQSSIVYPGAAYIEMGLAVAKARFDNVPCMLSNVEIKTPLLLQNDDGSIVHTMLQENNAFTVYSENINKEWTKHISGLIAKIKEWPNSTIDVEKIKKRCTVKEEKQDSYKRFNSLGLEYGPEFQSIQHLWMSKKEILGKITISRKIESQLKSYYLHPAILDACFQVMASIPMDGTFLPVKIDKIKLFKQPGASCFSYAQIKEQKLNRVKGDIKILDEKGGILAEVEGLECQYVEGTRKLQHNTIAGNLYEYQWLSKTHSELEEKNSAVSYLSSPSEIYKTLENKIPSFIKQYERKRFYKVIEPKIDNLCKEYFVFACKQLGMNFNLKDTFLTENILKKLGIVKTQQRLFKRILQILEQEKILQKHDVLWKVTSKPADVNPEQLWKQMFLEYPNYVAELLLIQRCGSNLVNILTGKQDPLELIFPSGSLVAEHLYCNAPTFRIYNRMVQEALAVIINNLPEGQTLNILEIGAGTGSLSSYVLPILPSHRVKYVFTDISAAFTVQAEKKFKAYDFIEYKALNIEQDAVSQGFQPHSFDIILASDAIHATVNLRNTLGNIKSFLASHGTLILLEATKPVRWFDLVWGTLKGWWLFSDLDIRPDHVLLSKYDWVNLFREHGFTETIGLTDKIKGHEPLHNVLLAQGPQVNRPVTMTSVKEIDQNQSFSWIILADNAGIAKQLAGFFNDKKISPIIVSKGKSFQEIDSKSFIICPDRKEDVAALFNIFEKRKLGSPFVINMWNVKSYDVTNKMGAEELRSITNGSCMQMLYIVQELNARKWNGLPCLCIVTNGTQLIGGLNALHLEQTPLWGLGRVVITEYPDWKNKIIDLSLNPTTAEINLLCKELLSNSDEDEISLRGQTRYVHRLLKKQKTCTLDAALQPFSLCKVPTKFLDEFMFTEIERKQLASTEVELQVQAVGLNKQDLNKAINILDVDLTPNKLITNFGVECSGIVTKVGADTKKFKVGDEVMGFVTNACSTYVTTNSQLLSHKPANLSYEDAAAILEEFVKAHYILHNLAKIVEGETVLINSADNAIGFAMLQIVRDVKGKLLVTANTKEKRELFRSLGVECVEDYKTKYFYEAIMKHTKKQGVDIIINTLPEREMNDGLSLLKSVTGRYIDLSNNKILKTGVYERGISFYKFSLNYIKENHPEIIEAILKKITQKFAKNKYYAPVYRTFPMSDIVNAFCCIKNENHIGTVVLSMSEPGIVVIPTQEKITIRKKSTYLMTGGLGGFGLATAKWLVECGAKHLVLLGRSGDAKPDAQRGVQELRDMGAEVFVGKVDVTDEKQIKEVLSLIEKTMPPLRGIIHAAMVLDDVFISHMTPKRMAAVLEPKILGAWNLHAQTLNRKLDFFISFSSFTSLIGNEGQGNYAAGNLFLDSLSYYRKLQGLPALTVCWGAIAEVGYVASREDIKRHFQRQGVFNLTLNQAWNTIKYGVEQNVVHIGAMAVDWKKFSKYAPALLKLPRFNGLLNLPDRQLSKSNDNPEESLVESVFSKSPAEVEEYLMLQLTKIIANILGLAVGKLNVEHGLDKYGLDSLMAVEVVVQIKDLTGVDLPKMTLLQGGISVKTLVDMLIKKIIKK